MREEEEGAESSTRKEKSRSGGGTKLEEGEKGGREVEVELEPIQA